jgi:TusA-related sulfurtransferase
MPGDVLEIHTPDPQRLINILNLPKETEKIPAVKAELYGSLIHVITPQAKKTIREIKKTANASDILIDSIVVVEPTLEDVFIACMQEG